MDAETRQTVNANRALANKNKYKAPVEDPDKADRDEYSKVIGRPVGIGDQSGFAKWKEEKRKKKMTPPPAQKEPVLTDIAKP